MTPEKTRDADEIWQKELRKRINSSKATQDQQERYYQLWKMEFNIHRNCECDNCILEKYRGR